MNIDFSSIPEYILFKDLTSLDEMKGRVMVDLDYEPIHFKKEDRKEVFIELLKYYRENGFSDLLNEYIALLSRRSYSNMSSISSCDNFAFNHPIVVMIYEFIGQGLLTKELEINQDFKLIDLGTEVLERPKAREKRIKEGVIFADGKLLQMESKDGHKIATLWLLLNGRNLNKAIRYTDDCIHPEPIFTSMSEYVKLESNEMFITEEQARAMYNIHIIKSRSHFSFIEILLNCKDLCINGDADREKRHRNIQMLDRAWEGSIRDELNFNSNSPMYYLY